ncbi:MAG: hypothetical protein JWP65_592 [Ramlibacter sp.]|nr:hypothetical protein [Ramlibacter sp.]MDB5750171.1 hypothetical protein [Ramlibacter sp.]
MSWEARAPAMTSAEDRFDSGSWRMALTATPGDATGATLALPVNDSR